MSVEYTDRRKTQWSIFFAHLKTFSLHALNRDEVSAAATRQELHDMLDTMLDTDAAEFRKLGDNLRRGGE